MTFSPSLANPSASVLRLPSRGIQTDMSRLTLPHEGMGREGVERGEQRTGAGELDARMEKKFFSISMVIALSTATIHSRAPFRFFSYPAAAAAAVGEPHSSAAVEPPREEEGGSRTFFLPGKKGEKERERKEPKRRRRRRRERRRSLFARRALSEIFLLFPFFSLSFP